MGAKYHGLIHYGMLALIVGGACIFPFIKRTQLLGSLIDCDILQALTECCYGSHTMVLWDLRPSVNDADLWVKMGKQTASGQNAIVTLLL